MSGFNRFLAKLGLPLIAFGSAIFAIAHVMESTKPPEKHDPPSPPVEMEFERRVAGVGFVEPCSEDIPIGVHVPGVVVELPVHEGEHVKKGALLFRIDDRHLRADLKVREAELAASKASLQKLKNQPRAEEVPVSLAKLNEADARLVRMRDQLTRGKQLLRDGAVTPEDLVEWEQNEKAQVELVNRMKAEHNLLLAGAWEPDLAIAQAAVAQAGAAVDRIKTELSRMEILAPLDAEILKIDIKVGQYVSQVSENNLMVLGDTSKLNVRVDINEEDIPSFNPGKRALAHRRGDSGKGIPLSFVRVEPYVVPKRLLTGDNTERVDTRVLRVIYQIGRNPGALYVGQQLDVSIDAGKTSPPTEQTFAGQ